METILHYDAYFVAQDGGRYFTAEDLVRHEGRKLRNWQVQARSGRKTFDGYVQAYTYEEALQKALA